MPETWSLLQLDEAVAGGEDQGLQPRVDAELVQYVHHVGAFGVDAHVEAGGYLLVREALGEGLEHLPLARCDLAYARLGLALLLADLAGEAEQLDDLLLGEEGLARPEAPGGVEDLVHVGGLVDNAGRPGLDRAGVLGLVHAGGPDQGREVPVGLAQVPDQLDALPVGEREVYDAKVGAHAHRRPPGLRQGPGLCYDLEIRLPVKDVREGLPERGVVFDEQDPLHSVPFANLPGGPPRR